jgi:hypothetical protein
MTLPLISSLLVEDLTLVWYNDGVQVWDEHKREHFQLKAILLVTVSDSPMAHNLSGQSKKVGFECLHYFRETDSVFERVTKNSVHGTSMLHFNEHQF